MHDQSHAAAPTPSPVPQQAAFQEALRRRVSRQQFNTWFQRTRVVAWTPGCVELGVPNRFYLEWIQRNFLGVIGDAATDVEGAPMRPLLRLAPPTTDLANPGGTAPSDAEEAPELAPTPAPRPSSSPAGEAPAGPVPRKRYEPTPFAGSGAQDTPLSLGEHYTFDRFVTGPANAVAYASARAVAQKPGRAYNPLFIHGAVGLGKTHLLQAICRTFLDAFPQDRVCYLSCEEFTNEFIQALKRKDVQRFRDRFRNVHLLVIDDIHFLKGKEQTQEEFFHTFNNLYQSHRQIVLSSDAAPSQIPSLEDRLISRFQWGLVTKLEQPDMETRQAIVQHKAELQGLDVPTEVLDFIAHHFRNNIRELEGALSSLAAHAQALKRPMDLSMAQEALAPAIHETRPAPSIDEVVSLVCHRFDVTVADLQGARRTRTVSAPRQIAMHLVRRVTGRSLEEIGTFFGGRDHSTVLYALKRVDQRCSEDRDFAARLDRMADRLGAR